MHKQLETLVTGATGKTGRRIVDALKARSLPVRRGSRSGVPPFDWQDSATWPEALRGVDQVYIAYQPDLAVPEARSDIQRLTELAEQEGVRRLVLLSGRGEEGAVACEDIVKRSGMAWTVIRASWFAQNFSEGHFLGPILSGTVALPAGSVAEPFIDVEDIADIAVDALTSDRHVGRLYEVTGPRLLTFAEAVDEIGRANGSEISYLPITGSEFRRELKVARVPDDFASFLAELMTTVLDGRNAYVSDGVEQALGRPARDFSDYARSAAAAGVWRAS